MTILSSAPQPPPRDPFAAEVLRRQQEVLRRIDEIRVAVLIWGPAPDSTDPLAAVRIALVEELRALGHLAQFSEDLIDPDLNRSIMTQQLAHVEAHDITFSLPSSPGSVAEIHDFARIAGVSNKIVAFLNSAWNDGYANQTLIELATVQTVHVQGYDAAELPDCIVEYAVDQVRRLQEVIYAVGRRI